MPDPDASSPADGPTDERPGDGGKGDPDPPSAERRRLLAALTLGIGGVAGTSLLAPWLGLFLTPVARTDPDAWTDIGSVSDFPLGQTLQVTFRDPAPLPWAGYAARSAAWVRRDSEDAVTAFTTYCTHVGCAVRWQESAGLFLCPCHGGAFYADGSVAAGPPPRPLDRHPVRIRNGRVEIRAEGIPEPRG